jgi:hypothetical protein
MNIKTIIAIIFSFFASSPVFAMDYPTFAGITISETTTATEYIVYFFNLAVAIGAFIAVIMVIMAGIEWVTSSGNPSKVESAKEKITNTIFGICVLLGCYLILRTINPQLTTIQIDNLSCEHGIVVSVTQESDGRVKQECIDNSQAEIKDTITSTQSWNFPAKYLLKAYTYSEANYKGTITEFDCGDTVCSGDISGAKSLYLVLNSPGIYLYDGTDFDPENPAVKSYPLFTATSIPDLSNKNSFDNFTKSIDIVNPPETATTTTNYVAVAFKSQNYQGRCAFIAQPNGNLDTTTVNGWYTDRVGNKAISSIIVAKSIVDPSAVSVERGEVIFYTKTDCGKSDNDPTNQIKSCRKDILNNASGQVDFLSTEGCINNNIDPVTNKPIGFVEGDEVMSFEITGAAGLVLSTAKKEEGDESTYCQYFNKSSLGGGTCFSSIRDTPIFTVGGKTPQSYIILPDN